MEPLIFSFCILVSVLPLSLTSVGYFYNINKNGITIIEKVVFLISIHSIDSDQFRNVDNRHDLLLSQFRNVDRFLSHY